MTFGRIVGAALQAIGVAALLAVAAGAYWIYGPASVAERPSPIVEPLDGGDLRTALARAGVDAAQDWSVIASLHSETGLVGRSRFDYACIQLQRFEPSADVAQDWAREPETNPLLQQALAAALDQAGAHGARCLPDATRANSTDFARNFAAVEFDRRLPNAAVIFLYEWTTRRLYYIDFAS
ncbi:hypothetical protein [Dokdonella sp.]|uniref:hypothetical protein n=1 Tax=Dokdonella sp. TaxID=2291710 RepID=UPI001B0DEA77|nr:hypothetical protein [Dokdonella sp.]MBO9664508.1 hypothetical protein [Dokdonella sp.]